jgi:oxygen-independent coproporphyrinogen-3 oxidase
MNLAPALPSAPLSIYIHVPFCAHICPYCDFTTYAGKESIIPRYVESVRRELDREAAPAAGRQIGTIFFGGGTPSLLEGSQIAAILNQCRASFDISPDAEISLEANPNGLDVDRLTAYRAAGVNRLSIGAQTFDRRGLRTLGRQHEATDVETALRASREAGFEQINLDLIFAWPGQTIPRWQADLDHLLELDRSLLTHLSLYSLIIEPGTPFADAAARGILRMPDDDESAEFYELAMSTLATGGWSHYEVANWAREPGDASRHNIQYWRNGDYLGIGAGAHGTVAGKRTMNHLLPERYCEAIEQGEPAHSNLELIEGRLAEGETMMLGLRLLEDGVNRDSFQRRHGKPMEDVFGATVADLVAIGMLEDDGIRVRLTPRGLMLANDVAGRFLM